MSRIRHFIDLWALEPADLRLILDDAAARKSARKGWPKARVDADAPARDRSLAMIFEKNSTRTRFSFDAAIRQLGGASIIATASDMQLGRGEPIEDTARVLSRYVDAIMIRMLDHAAVRELLKRGLGAEGIEVADGKMRVSVFGRNLLDDRGTDTAFTVAGLWSFATAREPRTYGVQFKAMF